MFSALLASQNRLRKEVKDFTYTLGFSGSYFRNGDDLEDRGDELLVGKFLYFFLKFRAQNWLQTLSGSLICGDTITLTNTTEPT